MAKGSQRQRNLIIGDKLTFASNGIIRVKNGNDYDEIDLSELTVLDVVAGTGEASKAMVLDSSGDITMPGVITFAEPQEYDSNTAITAFATGGQASATALTGEFNNITTCATAGDSVKLPAAALGLNITVKNSGAASLAVFPNTSDSINALAVNLSINVPVGGTVTFNAISAVVYETNEVLSVSASTTQTGEFGIKATDNAADHEILLTNASHGQATVHSIPDPGASTANIDVSGAAQVHKTEAVTTTNVITASESGTRFILNTVTAFVSTLPAPAANLEYWFYIGATEPTTTHTVVTNASANIIVGNISSPDLNAASDVSTVTDADTISFIASKAVHGDYAHVWSDGTNWYLDGMCKAFDGMTTTQAS
jgi:hypothetical protein